MNPKLWKKTKESLSAVLPMTAIVMLISIFIVPMELGKAVMFAVGVGMFLAVALIRIKFKLSLLMLLIILYTALIVLSLPIDTVMGI